MRKKEIVKEFAARLDIPKPIAEYLISMIVEEMINGLSDGSHMLLSGFGTFKVVNRGPRLGRNPKTGCRIRIPKHKEVRFTPSVILKDNMNNGH